MMMKNGRLKNKDWQIISAYLDGQLTEKQETAFEVRLKQEEELRDALKAIQWTKSVLRKAPHRKVPHHFILTRQMAAEAKRHQNRVIRQYGLVSGIASLTFLILVGIQLLPLFKMGMAPNVAMAPKEALMEESVIMEAEACEEVTIEDDMQVQEAPVVAAEPAMDVETAELVVGGAEEELNEITESVEEGEMQPPVGADKQTITPTPETTENFTLLPTAAATSVVSEAESDANMVGGAPRAEETAELLEEVGVIEEDASTNVDEGLLDQQSIDTGESLTMQPSVLEMLIFAGMLVSAFIAIIALVAVFRTKNRS